MKFDLEWLRQHIDGDTDADTLSEGLTHCGFLVETRDPSGQSEIWDVEATTNRPDVMCHRGLAREAALAVGARLKALHTMVEETGEPAETLASVEIQAEDLCSRYVGRVLRGVRLVESPDWLKERLERCGIRPINAVVDATNYVLLETGQPLHAFDLDRLEGRTIVVRRATKGEVLTTLDGEDRKLECDDLVIADRNRSVALAGVMGGTDSEIGEETTDVLLESAHFEALPIRRTARRFGMHTEASHRFERGADPLMAPVAADLAARLIAELTGATVSPGRIDVCPRPWRSREMTFSVSGVSRFAGLEIAGDEIVRILEALEFKPGRDGDVITCVPPSFRGDIERVADLYEEIIRHIGYDAVPAVLPILRTPPGRRHPNWELVDRGRRAAVACGLTEAVTYAFIDPQVDQRLKSWPLCPGPSIPLVNPLAETQGTMRRSLIPGLLAAARENLNQGEADIALFEEGRVFSNPEGDCFEEPEYLSVVLAGGGLALPGRDAVDFLELKGVVEALLRDAAFPEVVWQRGGSPWLDEAEGAVLVDGDGKVVGVAGRLGDDEAGRRGFKQPVYVAELRLQAAAVEPPLPRFETLPRFPAVWVDITVEHGVDLPYAVLEAAVRELSDQLVMSVSLVARFTGKALGPDRIRTTLRLVYRHSERSMTQEEVNAAQDALRAALVERLDVTI
ncbi:MAG: phenylalanine--tRNA ligase subunit beta [Acidobacteria bacterium]|nr:MAG: phenylalanine--tRNA ligase subunit beta [Acidobacteriota bacterium]